MSYPKNIFSVLFLIFFIFLSANLPAQMQGPNTPSWGPCKLYQPKDFQGAIIDFNNVKEEIKAIFIDKNNLKFASADFELHYELSPDGQYKLLEVTKGIEYFNGQMVKAAMQGFSLKGNDQEKFSQLISNMTDLFSWQYKVEDSKGFGFVDAAKTEGSGLQLYGKGNAYRGAFSKGTRNGKGLYVIHGNQLMDGVFKDGVQHGTFKCYAWDGSSESVGAFQNGKLSGDWFITKKDGRVEAYAYHNGQRLPPHLESIHGVYTAKQFDLLQGKPIDMPFKFYLQPDLKMKLVINFLGEGKPHFDEEFVLDMENSADPDPKAEFQGHLIRFNPKDPNSKIKALRYSLLSKSKFEKNGTTLDYVTPYLLTVFYHDQMFPEDYIMGIEYDKPFRNRPKSVEFSGKGLNGQGPVKISFDQYGYLSINEGGSQKFTAIHCAVSQVRRYKKPFPVWVGASLSVKQDLRRYWIYDLRKATASERANLIGNAAGSGDFLFEYMDDKGELHSYLCNMDSGTL